MSSTATSAAARGEPSRPRDEIIDVAAQCFMARGYHTTSVDDVARALNCTKGRIYHYYDTKTDLFFDVHREGMARLIAAVERALGEQGDACVVLRAMLLSFAEGVLENHAFSHVVAQGAQVQRLEAMSDAQREAMSELRASRAHVSDLFKARLSVGMEEGSVRPSDVSVTAKMLVGAVICAIYWYRPPEQPDAEARRALAEKMVAPLIDGVRAGA